MSPSTDARRLWGLLRIAAIVALLALTAYTGVVDGSRGARSASTAGERVATAMQLLYGACAVTALVAMLAKRGWVFPLLVVWAVALTLTGALASVVFGGTTVMVGVGAGAVVALVAGLALWGWRTAGPYPGVGTRW